MSTKSHTLALILALAATCGTSAVQAQAREQDRVRGGLVRRQILPLPEIEAMVLPRMPGARYIGPELIDDDHYRLKFMRGTKVIWVDVDARTGAIVGRAGD